MLLDVVPLSLSVALGSIFHTEISHAMPDTRSSGDPRWSELCVSSKKHARAGKEDEGRCAIGMATCGSRQRNCRSSGLLHC